MRQLGVRVYRGGLNRGGIVGKKRGVTNRSELHFEVDANLLFHLGEELVTRRSVALAELIKNSYDADAKRVLISFHHVTKPNGTIVVEDDGTGMSLSEIQDHWMRIATTRKLHDDLSPKFKRARAGAKGIGRFAARRIAQRLTITTTARLSARPAEYQTTTLWVDWAGFQPGTLVGSVPIHFETSKTSLRSPTGTKMTLEGVREIWYEDDFREVRQDITKLISPLPSDAARKGQDPGFSVEIIAPEFPEHSGGLAERFLSSSLAKLNGQVDARGKATFTLRFRGRKKPLRFSPDRRYPNIGKAAFEIFFFVYKRDYFADLPINTREAQALGRDHGGVHIYVDRFRVPPYGDPGDDWLELDQDRGRRLTEMPAEIRTVAGHADRPMLSLPGNNQLFGRVYLSRLTNPQLRQTADREGLIDTEGLKELRAFVRLGIDWMTVIYHRDLAAKSRKDRGLPRAVDALSHARATIERASDDLSDEQRAEIIQAIDIAVQAARSEEDQLISELSMLRVLASTGTMIVVFQHQLSGTLLGLNEAHDELEDLLKRVAKDRRAELREMLDKLRHWIASAETQAELLGLLASRAAHERRFPIAVSPVVDRINAAFKSYAEDNGIEIRNEVPNSLRTPPMFEAELTAILVNLLTNALKAVRDQTVRRIAVRGARDGGFVLSVLDTGSGLRRKDSEEYFKPFVGDAEPDLILGHGTGLGLKIVKDFVTTYGGEVHFVDAKQPWHTAIEIRMPVRK
jgi:signal transduction histidine kinase